jgi:hypothetical protein
MTMYVTVYDRAVREKRYAAEVFSYIDRDVLFLCFHSALNGIFYSKKSYHGCTLDECATRDVK